MRFMEEFTLRGFRDYCEGLSIRSVFVSSGNQDYTNWYPYGYILRFNLIEVSLTPPNQHVISLRTSDKQPGDYSMLEIGAVKKVLVDNTYNPKILIVNVVSEYRPKRFKKERKILKLIMLLN